MGLRKCLSISLWEAVINLAGPKAYSYKGSARLRVLNTCLRSETRALPFFCVAPPQKTTVPPQSAQS